MVTCGLDLDMYGRVLGLDMAENARAEKIPSTKDWVSENLIESMSMKDRKNALIIALMESILYI
jgi:hypothetical protein